jgi:hypothetical protein
MRSTQFTYPKISGPSLAHLDLACTAFEKYDGIGLRFFWNRQEGWHAAGTKLALIDARNPTFAPALRQFQAQFAEPLIRMLREHTELTECVAFTEWHAVENKEKTLTLVDLYANNRAFLPTSVFVCLPVPTARVVYEGLFTRALISDVRRGALNVGEGIVARGEGWQAQIKTDTWMARLRRMPEQRRAGLSGSVAHSMRLA